MSEDRTEQPSAKRLKDARKKGQIVRSRDLAVAVASIATTMAIAALGGRLLEGLRVRLATDLTHFGDTPLEAVTAGDINGMVLQSGQLIAVLVGPIAMAALFAGLLTHTVQGGVNIASEALTLNWGRLNPVEGFKKFGIMQSGADTLKAFMSVAAIAYLGWLTVDLVMRDGARLPWLSPVDAAGVGWGYVERLLWQIAFALVFLAMADYGLQHYRLMKSLKMTKQELRDEAKENEGNAEVKGKVRRIQREMSRRRMLSDVKNATVVITNPTHFAIALEYKRGTMAAPKVLAKGADHIAAQIREQARKHGIPMFENKPLAQALYKTAEVGEPIPAGLFAAVAEVLAQLIRLKQLVL